MTNGDGAGFANRMKDCFLADPITEDGDKALKSLGITMTKDDFYDGYDRTDKIYVEPFSEFTKDKKKDDIADDYTPYTKERTLSELKHVKESFESEVRKLSRSIFVIKGVAGCGKTTYLNYLERNLSNDIKFHIRNMELTERSIFFIKGRFDFEERQFNNNVYKVISAILNEISMILLNKLELKRPDGTTGYFEYIQNAPDDNREYVRKIVEEYKKYLDVESLSGPVPRHADVEEQRKLFEILEKYSNSDIEIDEFSTKLIDVFRERFLQSDDAGSKLKKEELDLAFVAGFLIRLFFCCYVIDKSKKYLFVIDNIEAVLKNDSNYHVRISELESIVRGCDKARKDMDRILIPVRSLYGDFYGLLFVMRDTTSIMARIGSTEHDNDHRVDVEVDISEWFCTADIWKHKKKFLESKKSVPTGPYLTAYTNILNDFSDYSWNLFSIIPRMYNYSHRRIIQCVPEALQYMPEEEIKYFNKMWDKAEGGGKNKGQLKALCRKYILRILMDYIRGRDYFDMLMVENLGLPIERRNVNPGNYEDLIKPSSSNENSSYARKITMFLYRQYLRNLDGYVSFPRLINTILMPPFTQTPPNEGQIENLGKILHLMGERKVGPTNWTTLVSLRLKNNRTYNEIDLCNEMKNQWSSYKSRGSRVQDLNDTIEFGVRITPAGSLFARMLPEFEYFACRFLSGELPLLSKANVAGFKVDGDDAFRAIAIIRVVRKKAFECIEKIIKRDMDFFVARAGRGPGLSKMYDEENSWLYMEPDGKETLHVEKIFNVHKGYLDQYKIYVSEFIDDEDISSEDRNKLIGLISKEIDAYIQGFDSLKKKYADYFRRPMEKGA